MRNRHCTITREHGPWLRSQKNHTRRRSCPADVLKLRGRERKQEPVHQPGAAPPSSSTGRRLNSLASAVACRQPAKIHLNSLNRVAASIFPPGNPGKSLAVAKHTSGFVESLKARRRGLFHVRKERRFHQTRPLVLPKKIVYPAAGVVNCVLRM